MASQDSSLASSNRLRYWHDDPMEGQSLTSADGERKYVIGPQLGSGAFACVCKATESSEGTQKAIKLFHRWSEIRVAEEELKILRILKDCDNTHLVKFFEEVPVFTSAGEPHCPAIVMELCDFSLEPLYMAGGRRVPAPSWPVFLHMCRQAFDGLAACHQLQVLHRDLSNRNILIKASAGFELKLADFGVSHDLRRGIRLSKSPVHGIVKDARELAVCLLELGLHRPHPRIPDVAGRATVDRWLEHLLPIVADAEKDRPAFKNALALVVNCEEMKEEHETWWSEQCETSPLLSKYVDSILKYILEHPHDRGSKLPAEAIPPIKLGMGIADLDGSRARHVADMLKSLETDATLGEYQNYFRRNSAQLMRKLGKK